MGSSSYQFKTKIRTHYSMYGHVMIKAYIHKFWFQKKQRPLYHQWWSVRGDYTLHSTIVLLW